MSDTETTEDPFPAKVFFFFFTGVHVKTVLFLIFLNFSILQFVQFKNVQKKNKQTNYTWRRVSRTKKGK